ncbi:hypothetical protein [Micavibrio aeruginosavorus]|uniref:hypothetical protein n=1 Tax=Micavibrio aeruginosavorus TaxID=349221 RepID=UPI003F4A9016
MMAFRSTSLVLGACALLGLGGVLGACAVTQAIQDELFDTSKINLTDSSYAAADMLAQQSRAHVNAATPVQIFPLYDVAIPGELTPFGQTVSSQLGARFVQLGYNVYTGGLPPDSVPSTVMAPQVGVGAPQPVMKGVTPSSASGMKKPGLVQMYGSYARGKDHLMISLQMIQAETGRVLSAYDYTLPATRQLREMSMTKAERDQAATGMAYSTVTPPNTAPVAQPAHQAVTPPYAPPAPVTTSQPMPLVK